MFILFLPPCFPHFRTPLQVSNDFHPFPHSAHFPPVLLHFTFKCLCSPPRGYRAESRSLPLNELTACLPPSVFSICAFLPALLFLPPPPPLPVMSMRNPPQRRRSLGPVSPKRIYRNLSVRLRGGESSVAGEVDAAKHLSKSADAVRTFGCQVLG